VADPVECLLDAAELPSKTARTGVRTVKLPHTGTFLTVSKTLSVVWADRGFESLPSAKARKPLVQQFLGTRADEFSRFSGVSLDNEEAEAP
jgi:hypothetical protein